MDNITKALIRIEEARKLEDQERRKTAKVIPLEHPIAVGDGSTFTVATKLKTRD